MSERRLANDARAELAAIAPTRRCDRLAETSALFHTAGTVHFRGRGALGFHLDLAESAAARRAFALLRELRIESQIRTYTWHAFDRPTRYQLLVDGTHDAIEILEQSGVVGRDRLPLDRPPGRVVSRPCCRAAYLRGAFLGGGSLSGPQSPHLEIRTPTHAGAAFLRSVASAAGVRLRLVDRSQHSAAYAKGWDAIEGYLGVAGAAETVVGLEERALVAGLRSEANRLANGDHANLVRQSEAARRQLAAIDALAANDRLGSLSSELLEAVELRKRYPMLALGELAVKMEPPVTKATAARRLARIVELADRPG